MIVILGAGYAGAATAWALARRGHATRVVIVEMEESAGRHASGLNAGLVTPLLDPDPVMAEMALRGAALLSSFKSFTRTGGIRLTSDEAAVAAAIDRARSHGVRLDVVPSAQAAEALFLLRGAPAAWALKYPDDGVVDPRGLVEEYLAAALAAGVRVMTGARAIDLAFSCGKIAGVETEKGTVKSDWVVNAAGAWASDLASRLAGGQTAEMSLLPERRHLFWTDPVDRLDPAMPSMWDLDQDVYVRASGGALLMCPCDAEPHADAPPAVSPAARSLLASKVAAALPALAGHPVAGERACLRTFAPDRRFVIGPDPRLPGFFWVAGLGGSGAVAGAAIGELAADLILTGGRGSEEWTRQAARHFKPDRRPASPCG